MIRHLLILTALFMPTYAAAEMLTSVRVLRPNTIIEPADLAILDKTFPGALGKGDDIIGLETRSTLYPGRPIRAQDVGPAALVKRNQHVTVIFKNGGLVISADARALQRGAVGEFVRVMNLSSRSTVSGRVAEDGSVVVMGANR